MKIHSRLCRITLLFFSHSILLLTSTAIVAAQKPGCDATVKAKLHFKELRTQFIKDRSSVDRSEFRRAARNYIRLAEQCYESTVGESALGQRIDDGGMWMGPSGATTTAPPVFEEFVLFGTKWGAGSPFAGGTDVPGPRLPGGTVTYSFMADGVNLTLETPELFNVAISSMGSFAPCFLDEIELAFGAWSAVADILFVPVADGGGPFNVDPVADIRIGAHVFDGPSGTLVHGWLPPPNGVTAAGDVHFDDAEPWTCAPGAGSFGFGIVAVHELGHAIGLSHELTEIAVMNPFYNPALTFGPLADDIIGAGEIYGVAGAAGTSFFGPVGIGASSPASQLHLLKGGAGKDGLPRITFDNADGSVDWIMDSSDHDRFRISVVGTGVQEFSLSSTGNLSVSGDFFSSTCTSPGSPCAPDYVFQPGYELESIDEHAAFTWENSHLPAVGPGQEKVALTKLSYGMLEEVEKAHIYIEQLNERLKQEETAIEQLNTFVKDKATQLAHVQSENATLAKRLARLEALLLAEGH